MTDSFSDNEQQEQDKNSRLEETEKTVTSQSVDSLENLDPIERSADLYAEDEEPAEDKALSDSPELFEFPGSPLIVPRQEHNVSRKLIDYDALKVMYRLIKAGYKAFLVGGGVRDLLLGKRPKDFDVGTSASPEDVRKLFRNSRIIGRRFRMNQVYFRGGKIVEVATFRAQTELVEGEDEPRMLAPDNTYGDEESDALRRDLTINGLFYDPNSYAVIDYVGGMDDLKNKIIRVIGDPDKRFKEDPVRMIRSVRHAARTGFEIEPLTKQSIINNAPLISKVVRARVYEEFTRDIRSGYAANALPMLQELGLLQLLMPELSKIYTEVSEEKSELLLLLENTLTRIDQMHRQGSEIPVSVAFLALCIDNFASIRPQRGERPGEKLKGIIHELYSDIGVTKRDREDMEGIILLCHQLFNSSKLPPEKAKSLIHKPLIKEAILLLELTVNNEYGHLALESWKEILNNEPPRPRQRPPYRKNRRRRGGGAGARRP